MPTVELDPTVGIFMKTEIERKFLVKYPPWTDATPRSRLYQGYLSCTPESVVRVRADDLNKQAWITVKGPTQGYTRLEYEYEIPWSDSLVLRTLCRHDIVKTRYLVTYMDQTWHVDEFHGENTGLVTAELELGDEAEVWVPPPWLGAEVSHDARYFNNNLSTNPWSSWNE